MPQILSVVDWAKNEGRRDGTAGTPGRVVNQGEPGGSAFTLNEQKIRLCWSFDAATSQTERQVRVRGDVHDRRVDTTCLHSQERANRRQ